MGVPWDFHGVPRLGPGNEPQMANPKTPWDEAGHARTNPVRDEAGQYWAKLVWSIMG